MSRFRENDEYDPKNLVPTKHGFAIMQENMPRRNDVRWLKLPERHLYSFDGDGWYRIDPPEPLFISELKHG